MDSTACERSSIEEFRRDCCIHGYHVYKKMWEAAAGEVLECMRGSRSICHDCEKKRRTIMG